MNEITIKSQEDLVSFANEYVKAHNIITSKNYNLTNAMVGMYNNVLTTKVKDGRLVLEACTPLSIQKAIYTCIEKELTPTRNQVYFIPYGDELKEMDSYFGLIKMVRDYCGINVTGDVVLQGDSIKVEKRIDGTKVIYHQTSAENILNNNPIIGAYAIGTDIKTGRVVDSDLMSMKDIKTSITYKSSIKDTHKLFENRMVRKVPIRRLCTFFLNTADDSKFGSYDDMLDEDNFVDCSYTINTEEQIKKETSKYEPTEEDVITADDLKLDSIDESVVDIPEGAVEVPYAEFKNNSDKYKMVKDSYNSAKKTCLVTVIG